MLNYAKRLKFTIVSQFLKMTLSKTIVKLIRDHFTDFNLNMIYELKFPLVAISNTGPLLNVFIFIVNLQLI